MDKVFQLKIRLKGVKPPIWRRILITSDSTFYELHVAIQDSFGWLDYHLHQFFIGSFYDINSLRLCIPDEYLDNEGIEYIDETKVSLSKYLNKEKQKISYEYDFGDSWIHEILLEKILDIDKGLTYPQILKGKRACPWEDSGGIWGYEEKQKIITNPKHKEYKEIMNWLELTGYGKNLEDTFDISEVEFSDPEERLKETMNLKITHSI